ncbi:hypothetical protein N431DRAFT_464540 [Stipitochalara longipes BDJ]|nr:hypothetical protein N431DRAFT_464540 [Stipitochalara longipes BDJ]
MADTFKESSLGGSQLPMRPGLRREKPQLACTSCRGRKVKCDRNQPCQNCTRRGQAGSCTFVDALVRRRVAPSSSSEARSMRQRVTQLEGMLRSFIEPSGGLATPRNYSEPPSSQSVDDSSKKSHGDVNMDDGDRVLEESNPSPGQLTLDNSETSYVGSTHWAAVLNEVVDLKDLLDSHDSPNSSNGSNVPNEQGIDLLFSTKRAVSQKDILASIPPRDIVDRLISKYFSVMDMALTILHIPTFQKDYEQFWLDPLGASVMWLSVLFSMMSLAEQVSLVVRDGPPATQKPQNMMHKYREKASQCLTMGNYTKPTEFVLEALLHYYAIEQYRSSEDHFGNSILTGIMVRTAMRMGYHRDPSYYSNIPVLQGEMRRRIWSAILIADIVSASQVGLPRLINECQTDTKLPHNLLDEDFDEHTIELPRPRPDTENTMMLYVIMKHKLHVVFGKIGDQTMSTQAVSYTDDVMRLDKLLHDTHNLMPLALRMRSTIGSVTDSSALILRRYALEVLFQKSRCVLHRRYLVLARSDHRYLYSRQSCVDSAMELLRHQSVVHSECQPGGLLQRESWKIRTLMVQEFLLAAMIICLEYDHVKSCSRDAFATPEEVRGEEVMLQALQKSYSIWQESASSSMEALKASTVLKMLLDKCSCDADKKIVVDSTSSGIVSWLTAGTDVTPSSVPNLLEQQTEESYDFLDDSFLDSSLTQQHDVTMDAFAFPHAEVIENMIYEPGNIDWAIWDTYT